MLGHEFINVCSAHTIVHERIVNTQYIPFFNAVIITVVPAACASGTKILRARNGLNGIAKKS